jgi:hypothetical protein
MKLSPLNRRVSHRAFRALWAQERRRSRIATVPPFEEYLLANFSANLLGYWKLGEAVGAASAADSSGRGINGLVTGVVFGQPGIPNSKLTCGQFGTGNRVRLEQTNTPPPLGTPRFTILCWFKRSGAGTTFNTGTGGIAAVEPLVTKGMAEAEGANKDANWILGLTNSGGMKLCADFEDNDSGPNHPVTGAIAITDNAWHLGAVTYDGTSLRLYVDGQPDNFVSPGTTPEKDSLQYACIGAAMTSAAAASGAFNGYLAHVAVWSEALSAANILALYNNGSAVLSSGSSGGGASLIYGANDNAIFHGTNFANWTLDAGSTKGAVGIKLVQNGTAEFAQISIAGLAPNTTYWCKCVVDSISVGANGNLRVMGSPTGGSNFSAIGGGDFNVAVGVGTTYFQLKTDASAGPHLLLIRHATSPDTEWIKFSDFRVFPIPTRSAAKVAVLGDRTGSFSATNGTAVDNAILAAAADTKNVIFMGDGADATTTYATANDTLKNAIIAAGGKIYACDGNHDWDGTNENSFPTYYDLASNNNAGKFYYSVVLGQMEFFFINDNPEDADNAGGINATAAAFQASTMGQWIVNKIAASTARWKIVVIHHAAYSSSAANSGYASNRWNWSALGVHMVLQAHNHGIERINKDGIYFYTVAMGGGAYHGWNAKLPETEFRVESGATYGYLKIHDGANDLVLEYFDTAQNLLDRVKIYRS